MSNPLLDEMRDAGSIPSVEIALPTRGYFYPEGEVLDNTVNADELPVRSLSIIDETAFKDPMMLISGNAISKMINHITTGITDPGYLCEIDIQAILVACRIASYGNTLMVDHKCSSCNEQHTMDINLTDHIQNYNPFTPEEFKEYDLFLERTGQTIRLRPIRYKDSVEMTISNIKTSFQFEQYENMNDQEALSAEFIDIYNKQFEDTVNNNIHAVISSILYVETKSGKKVTDQNYIEEWFIKLIPQDVKIITDKITRLNEKLQERSQFKYNCPSCNAENMFYVELDPQKLFMPAEDLNQETNSSAKSKDTKTNTKTRSRVSQR